MCVKSKESVTALAQQLPESAAPCGLVHARFATCGGRTAENVHPFVTDDYCLAMNGTVENAVALRSALNLLPYPDSDGAVLAALLQAYADSGTVAALRLCCREARGNYALAVLRRGEECLFACAHGAAAVCGGRRRQRLRFFGFGGTGTGSNENLCPVCRGVRAATPG